MMKRRKKSIKVSEKHYFSNLNLIKAELKKRKLDENGAFKKV